MSFLEASVLTCQLECDGKSKAHVSCLAAFPGPKEMLGKRVREHSFRGDLIKDPFSFPLADGKKSRVFHSLHMNSPCSDLHQKWRAFTLVPKGERERKKVRILSSLPSSLAFKSQTKAQNPRNIWAWSRESLPKHKLPSPHETRMPAHARAWNREFSFRRAC